MTKAKKTIAVLLCVLTLLCVCCNIIGCVGKYYVVIKIACREVVNGNKTGRILETFVFQPRVDEMHIERKYDGKEYSYYVCGYNLPMHPRWWDMWFDPNKDDFKTDYYQSPPENGNKRVCERGEYKIVIEATDHIPDGKPRKVTLYVTVV